MHVTKTGCLVFSAFLAFLAAAAAGCSSAPGPGADEPPAGGGSGGSSESSGGSSPTATGGRSSGRDPDASSGGPSGGSSTGGSSAGGSSAGGDGGSTAGGDGGSSAGGSGAMDAGAEVDAASSGPADPAAGVFPIPPGLTKIFDGTSLAGWDGDAARWSVNAKDMAIQGRTGGGNLIKTTMDYGDFRLILTERMVLPGPSTNHLGECFWGGAYKAGNFGFGGCIVFIAPHGSLWDYGGGGNVFTGMGAGMKTDWQQIEILAIASTGQILAAVNGVQTTNYTRKSKGKPSPIGLQSHADHAGDSPGMIEYKDIYVESPPKSMTLLTVKH
jgi:hypothetical protein